MSEIRVYDYKNKVNFSGVVAIILSLILTIFILMGRDIELKHIIFVGFLYCYSDIKNIQSYLQDKEQEQ